MTLLPGDGEEEEEDEVSPLALAGTQCVSVGGANCRRFGGMGVAVAMDCNARCLDISVASTICTLHETVLMCL